MRHEINPTRFTHGSAWGLLFALCLLLISPATVFAQSTLTTPGTTPTASPAATTPPAATPTVTPAVTATPTPSASATPAEGLSSQGESRTPNGDSNASRESGGGQARVKFMGNEVEGPVWVVLIVFAVLFLLVVVPLILARKARAGINSRFSMSTATWIIILLLSSGLFFFFGGLLSGGESQAVKRSEQPRPTLSPEPIAEPTSTTTPTPTQAQAQTQTTTPSTKPTPCPTPSSTPCPTPSPAPSPTPAPTPFALSVSDVKVAGDDVADKVAGLGDRLIVTVKNLKEELAREQKLGPEVPRTEPGKYVLFLNDMEIKKLYPVAFDPDLGALHFDLSRTAESNAAWANLLAGQGGATRVTKVSVGPEGQTQLPSRQSFSLRIYRRAWLNFGIVLFLIAVAIFLWLARSTSIIRDSGPPEPPQGAFRPYSLARSQAAWWFFIILGSFLFIALVTQAFDTITSSSLVLLGIGTGTALGAALLDINKRDTTNNELLTLKPRQAALAEAVAQLRAQIAEFEAKRPSDNSKLSMDELAKHNAAKQELGAKEAELAQVDRQVADSASELNSPVSEGFVKDILSDVNGVTFHRFQILVWTLVMGLIFVWSVWKRLVMPEFSDTLLALMGISAGTYIGFKIPERQAASGAQQPPTPPQQKAATPP